jgi:hypothetical protein
MVEASVAGATLENIQSTAILKNLYAIGSPAELQVETIAL